jgi:3-methyladenine DNA glycosylase/8-oxoguanine DNA glycosylase
MTLLAFRTIVKKTWVWLKHNWYVPAVIAYTLVLWLLFRNKTEAMDILELRANSYKDQIRAIEDAHQKELKERDEILKRYNAVLEQLEKDYEEKNIKLDKKKKEDIKRIVEDYNDRPDDLARVLANKYGLEYVE